jgi:dynein heavy chain 1
MFSILKIKISVIIDYGKVQSKVSLKYDSWHKDALGKFGNLLGNEMSLFHTQVPAVI